MLLPNCPEFVTIFLAIQRRGAVVINAGPLMGLDDLGKLMALTTPRLAVGLDMQEAALRRVGGAQRNMSWLWVSLRGYQSPLQRAGYLARLWLARSRSAGWQSEITLESLLALHAPVPPPVELAPDDLAVLQPTGGTTGVLKAAEITHRNLLANATQVSAWSALRPGQERVLGLLPLFHVFGLTIGLTSAMFHGAALILLTRFRAGATLATILKERPTVLPLAPLIVGALCDELAQRPRPGLRAALAGTLVVSGAAPLPPALSQRFELLAGVRVIQGYGLTEASPVTHINPRRDPRRGSIGVPLPDTLTRVVSLDDPLVPVPVGAAGELLVSGPQVCRGYIGNPEETARTFTMDAMQRRWLRTGDVVRVDQDGYFYVVDRKKEMINRAGLKVWPAKVERVLQLHPAVADAAVLGQADQAHTEIVVAVIVLGAAAKPSPRLAAHLRALCREHLAPYEVPQRFVFVDRLPRSPLGKLNKSVVRDMIGARTAPAGAAQDAEPDLSAGPGDQDNQLGGA